MTAHTPVNDPTTARFSDDEKREMLKARAHQTAAALFALKLDLAELEDGPVPDELKAKLVEQKRGEEATLTHRLTKTEALLADLGDGSPA